jgi:hypothetical protein
VPRETFDELLAAESKGQFMQANIIYHFRHERVDNSMKTFTAEYKCEVTKHYVILAASLEEAYDKAKIFDVEDDGVEVDMEEWELNDVTERRE